MIAAIPCPFNNLVPKPPRPAQVSTWLSLPFFTGTDAIPADPFAVVANEDTGMGIDEILISNSDGDAHTVYVYAFE